MPSPVEIVWLSAYLGAVMALGWLVTAWVHGTERMSLPAWFGGLGIYGIIAVGFLQYWGALAGVPQRRPLVAGLALLGAVGLGACSRQGWLPLPVRPSWRGMRWPEAALAALALVALATALAAVTAMALAMPLFDIDSFTIWSLKAKVLFYDGLSPEAYFHQVNYGYSHLEYPLLGPFLSVGVHAAMGRVDDHLGKLPYVLQYAAFMGWLWAVLRRDHGRAVALLLTAALLASPAFVQWAGGGTADVLLAMFYAGSVFHLAAFLHSGRTRELRAAALFTAAMAFTKNEGLPLAAINLTITALCLWPGTAGRAARFRALLWCAAGAGMWWLTWAWWSADIPRIHEDYGGRLGQLLTADAWRRLPAIANEFLAQPLAWRRWGILWLALPLMVALRPAVLATRHGLAILLMLVAHLALYVVVFMITPWEVGHLVDMALERLMIHVAPALLLLAAVSPGPLNTLDGPGDNGQNRV